MQKITLIITEPIDPSSDMLRRRLIEAIGLNDCDGEIIPRIEFCDNVEVCSPQKLTVMAGIQTEYEQMEKKLRRLEADFGIVCRPSNLWSRELEELREPFRDAAERLSVLMTPVLIIDGAVKSSGEVPNPCKLDEWIKSANR